jgi:hypothetical protein
VLVSRHSELPGLPLLSTESPRGDAANVKLPLASLQMKGKESSNSIYGNVMKSYIRKQLLPILFSYLICEGSGLQTD